MAVSELTRWRVGAQETPAEPGTGSVALIAAPASAVAPGSAGHLAVWFHEAMETGYGLAGQVELWFPAYRGKSLVPLLAWLVTERLASRDAQVTWWLDKQQGPDSVARMLTGLGWALTRERDGRVVRLLGMPPPGAARPDPAQFTGRVGACDLVFAADYGVFSPRQIDDGTALLAQAALAQPPVDAVADIGVGYGALAIGLVASGIAERALATDVDSVALWLAACNARRHGVDLTVRCTPDPLEVPPTPLTVCNVPTHIDAAKSRSLMVALIRRAEHGRLMIVVHKSLEQRYAHHLTAAGLVVERHPGPAHTVLSAATSCRSS